MNYHSHRTILDDLSKEQAIRHGIITIFTAGPDTFNSDTIRAIRNMTSAYTFDVRTTTRPSLHGLIVMRRPLVTEPERTAYAAAYATTNSDIRFVLDRVQDITDTSAPDIALPPCSAPATHIKNQSVKSHICYDDNGWLIADGMCPDSACSDGICDDACSTPFPEPLSAPGICHITASPDDTETDDELSEQHKEWLDSLTALVLDYVTRYHEMPPMEKINAHIAGKITLARQGVSPVIVNGDMRIILPDYNELELRMTPLVRTVYILFLMHPEGIELKQIGAYRHELATIYLLVKPGADSGLAEACISDLTVPGSDSLRQKLSMAKRAINRHLLNPAIARQYYIDGTRGGLYRIAGFPSLKVQLPRILS